ncbi:MAG: hypothetical protein HUJ74_01820 [Lachnospiraceae bacterium]|nr:hypothetical protein [Lachnospiraceae bacterium]
MNRVKWDMEKLRIFATYWRKYTCHFVIQNWLGKRDIYIVFEILYSRSRR